VKLRVVFAPFASLPALTAIALCCFAGNSLLCRLALAERHIDAATFTAVRLASGALVLAFLVTRRPRPATAAPSSWLSAFILFGYAAPFSYAYLRLGAGMGALTLFASVQVTMIGWAVARGERPTALAWLGLVAAIAGLVGLTVPGATAPDPLGSAGMVVAGIAWGAYSLRGRSAGSDPVSVTAASFARTLPFAGTLLLTAVAVLDTHASTRGVVLAILSGGVASGVGYAIWYAALPGLGATRAAILQLLVPLLATGGAVTWLGESVSMRYVAASAAILGGVALAILSGGSRAARSRSR
jgi:drug/metabolite transporter (DMT)-like permease